MALGYLIKTAEEADLLLCSLQWVSGADAEFFRLHRVSAALLQYISSHINCQLVLRESG